MPETFDQLPESLRALAELALSNARRELEQSGKLNPSVALAGPDGKVEPYQLNDEMAGFYFSTAEGKEHFFALLRKAVELSGVTTVIMVNDIWGGRPTEKLMQLPVKEANQMLATKGLDEMARGGWITRVEAVMVTIQTPEYFATVNQEYSRDNEARRITWLDRDVALMPQRLFTGRSKIFGKREPIKFAHEA